MLARLPILRPAVAPAMALLLAHPASYVVRPGDTLSSIAHRQGVSTRALAQLNGIADADRIRIGRQLSIPEGGGIAAAPAPSERSHVVARGETLSSIARSFGVPVSDLALANGIVERDRVLTGSRLMVPTPGVPVVALNALPAVNRPGDRHVVAPGETLSGIAAAFGVRTADLAAANGIADPNSIAAGRELTIPGGWRCPVPGARFVNDFGVPKPGGRFHEGVDLFAPRGTPVVAPVGGTAKQIRGSIGGLQVWLYGRDGTLYIGSHLDSFGTGGDVAPGTQLGTVGTSGNAVGSDPHLHFEVHENGTTSVNPYPLLDASCR